MGSEATRNTNANTVHTEISSAESKSCGKELTDHEKSQRIVQLSGVVSIRFNDSEGWGEYGSVASVEETWQRQYDTASYRNSFLPKALKTV